MSLARAAITKLAGSQPVPKEPPDARVARAIELMRGQLGGTISLGSIAASVHLSPDRFGIYCWKRRAEDCGPM
jgi:transcriptional regulator GlxA family with amidase domain